MKIALLTNMPSYHQAQLGEYLNRILGAENFRLVFAKPTSDERGEMGWVDEFNSANIIRLWESEQAKAEADQWIATADVVVQGRVPMAMVRSRINRGKLTFAYQERFWKRPLNPLRFIARLPRVWRRYWSVSKPNYHLLAAGAYVASDLARIGCFKNRAWKFGYFIEPAISGNDAQKLQSSQILRLLWCARFSKVKQAHHALEIVRRLKAQGVNCVLTMVGDGAEREQHEASAKDLGDCVEFVGWQSSHDVELLMQKSDILLMTSGFGEGWAVVINEAVTNACMVVANQLIGAAPWLVKHGETGLLYDQAKLDDLVSSLVALDIKRIRHMGEQGKLLHDSTWSAASAAERLVGLSGTLLENPDHAQDLFGSGPCSPAA